METRWQRAEWAENYLEPLKQLPAVLLVSVALPEAGQVEREPIQVPEEPPQEPPEGAARRRKSWASLARSAGVGPAQVPELGQEAWWKEARAQLRTAEPSAEA